MKNHTPTPWAEPVTYGSSKFELLSGEFHARPIAVVNTLADAHRIRACVNACDGMKHPAAEIAALRKDHEYLLSSEKLRAKAIEQRNDLLAALKELVHLKNLKDRADNAENASEHDYCGRDYQARKPAAWNTARDAIAKVEVSL